MRPIDADKLKELLLKERDAIPITVVERYSLGVPTPNHHGQAMRGGIKKALRCMERTPTITYADLVPHGRWIDTGFENSTGNIYICSACNKTNNPNKKDVEDGRAKEKPDFCPNCGAKMCVK